MATSTITLQNVIDAVQGFGDIEPVLNTGGYSQQPALTIANDVMEAMLAWSTPWKWNRISVPLFYTNSFQQDYSIVGLSNLAWLENGICVDINNTAIPKPWAWVEVERDQMQSTTSTLSNSFFSSPLFLCNWRYNRDLYFGKWGASNLGNNTLGNNPQPNQTITNPLGQGSQPTNPIVQIQDANNNLLVLTTYGTTGTVAPTADLGAAPGTTIQDGTVIWTVVDPSAQGIRVFPVPSQTGVAWQFRLVGQAVAPRFTSLSQTLTPIPNDYESYFRQGFIAQCYRYSPEAKIRAKFAGEWQIWLSSLQAAWAKPDRERDEYAFVPDRGLMGQGTNFGWYGPAFPFFGPPGGGYGY